MSSWGQIDAEFYNDDDGMRARLTENLTRSVEERDGGCPTGSESGPNVYNRGVDSGTKSVWVEGSLRGMDDTDSPSVLAWFVETCKDVYSPAYYATLTWEITEGPRYRFQWQEGKLTRLKGMLDV